MLPSFMFRWKHKTSLTLKLISIRASRCRTFVTPQFSIPNILSKNLNQIKSGEACPACLGRLGSIIFNDMSCRWPFVCAMMYHDRTCGLIGDFMCCENCAQECHTSHDLKLMVVGITAPSVQSATSKERKYNLMKTV
jgi:hypothetical protein